ncbi:hypothetical protein EYF80_063599 [Liparis tanakae]|uniref:Uncharacterized protein n=1 Tax=Liparis tanakae TaxID=230148 RepID=A0A4Z2ECL5_9TELE|nr:hypothetical protein EYF80_063599 [Liparis tanakae]
MNELNQCVTIGMGPAHFGPRGAEAELRCPAWGMNAKREEEGFRHGFIPLPSGISFPACSNADDRAPTHRGIAEDGDIGSVCVCVCVCET